MDNIVLARVLEALAVVADDIGTESSRRDAAFFRGLAGLALEGDLDYALEDATPTYAEQLDFCKEHGFICLERYRRDKLTGTPSERNRTAPGEGL